MCLESLNGSHGFRPREKETHFSLMREWRFERRHCEDGSPGVPTHFSFSVGPISLTLYLMPSVDHVPTLSSVTGSFSLSQILPSLFLQTSVLFFYFLNLSSLSNVWQLKLQIKNSRRKNKFLSNLKDKPSLKKLIIIRKV